jgi:hypothetical protein
MKTREKNYLDPRCAKSQQSEKFQKDLGNIWETLGLLIFSQPSLERQSRARGTQR